MPHIVRLLVGVHDLREQASLRHRGSRTGVFGAFGVATSDLMIKVLRSR